MVGRTLVTSMGVRKAAGASGEDKVTRKGQTVRQVFELWIVTPVATPVLVGV